MPIGVHGQGDARVRVEKASLWAYRAALELIWYATPDKHVNVEVAAKVRPYAVRFLELCQKRGVQRTASESYFAIAKMEKRIQDHLAAGW